MALTYWIWEPRAPALELRRLALRRNCADCYLRSKQYGSTAQRP